MGDLGMTRKAVNHSRDEYVGKDGQTTNNIENFFSVFKRGMTGVYQHCAEKHLQRYLAEFDFRFNHRAGNGVNDAERPPSRLQGCRRKAPHLSADSRPVS